MAGPGILAAGSLSKTVWGGLRTGWIRGDREFIRRLALARGSQDVGSPVLDQLLAVEVLARIDDLLPGRRALLRERRDALLAALPPTWWAARPAGGMSVWALLPDGTAASALAARAADHGVRVAAGPRFSAGGEFEQRLRLPFTQPPERLAEAMRRLAAIHGAGAAAAEAAARWVA
jgi:DNA-binding transcriptional MocR family regulator